MDMTLRPIGDRILVKRVESETKSAGGIIIPETAKEKPQEAEVIAVGEGKLLDNGERFAPPVKPGDRVLFAKYSGDEIKLAGETHMIMRSDEILAIIES
jgi:chaperonin GroES